MSDFVLTIFTTVGNLKFNIDGSKMNCDKLIAHFQDIGDITYELPFTYFKGVQMIGYACEVLIVS